MSSERDMFWEVIPTEASVVSSPRCLSVFPRLVGVLGTTGDMEGMERLGGRKNVRNGEVW